MARVVLTSGSRTTVHELEMVGLAGAIILTFVLGYLLFIIGFATPGWSIFGSRNFSLWDSTDVLAQVTECLGFLTNLVTVVLFGVYMRIHSVNKNNVLIGIVTSIFLAGLFMLLGLISYGVGTNRGLAKLDYSYHLAAAGGVIIFISGILASAQMSRAGMGRVKTKEMGPM